MRAVVADPQAEYGWSFGETADPTPGPREVLVAVRHAALNFGDMLTGAMFPPATPIGWDASGIVEQAAADGSGPAVGTRVVTYSPNAGGWAQRRAVHVEDLAEVPDDVDLAVAASLPVAGVTALRTLRACGPLLGRTVLVTGASGGVGRFAVQLAAVSGAKVLASVGSVERGAGLAELGADEVVVGLDGVTGPLHAVLDTVGGPQLVAAWNLVGPGGSLQAIGWTSDEPATFPPYSIYGEARSITTFRIGDRVGADLAVLVDLVRRGLLTPEIGWRSGWEDLPAATKALVARTVRGKAVVDVN